MSETRILVAGRSHERNHGRSFRTRVPMMKKMKFGLANTPVGSVSRSVVARLTVGGQESLIGRTRVSAEDTANTGKGPGEDLRPTSMNDGKTRTVGEHFLSSTSHGQARRHTLTFGAQGIQSSSSTLAMAWVWQRRTREPWSQWQALAQGTRTQLDGKWESPLLGTQLDTAGNGKKRASNRSYFLAP